MNVKMLTVDLETSPSLAHVWSLWRQTVSLNQLMEATAVISWAAKWYGNDEVLFASDFHDGHKSMLMKIWALLDEADIIITYNGTTFDVPHLNREFLLAGLGIPSFYQHIDLYKTVKSRFRFISNKLDHIAKQLGVGQKVSHEGHTLWVKCMAGDKDAWETMKTYNMGDVIVTEKVYDKMKAWISGHPNLRLFSADPKNDHSCSSCAGLNLVKQGVRRTKQGNFQTYQCKDCGSWSTDSRSLVTVQTKAL
jgi:hypothetical protein